MQPFPSKPPQYSRNYLAADDVIDFTPALRAAGPAEPQEVPLGTDAIVPAVIPNETVLGSINVGNTMGGVNWPGAAFDPETATFYTQAYNSQVGATTISPEYFKVIDPAEQAKNRIPTWESPHFGKEEAAMGARGPSPLTEGLGGLPIIKPPYGVVAAIDLNKGTLKFQVPHGDTPDAVRNSPLLKGLDIPKTGQQGIVGVVVTKTLVIVGDPMITAPPDRPRGAMLRAYDKQTGAEVGAVWMPAAQSGNPMTYMAGGRQFIVVAVGGGTYSSEYIAFALPRSELRMTTER